MCQYFYLYQCAIACMCFFFFFFCVPESHFVFSRCSLHGNFCKKSSCGKCNRRQGNNLCKAWKQLLCSHVIWVKNKQIRPYGALLDHTICLLDDECSLYGVSIGKSILLKLKQYRVVLIRRAKSKWGDFDTSLQDSSLPSNDTLSILALHW